MKAFKSIGLIFVSVVVLTFSATTVQAKKSSVELKPQPYQKETSRWLVRLLEQLHYKPMKLNDEFSAQILDNYIEILDPNKVYFYKSDIEDFKTFRLEVDDAIKSGEVDFAFKMFSLYIKRIKERTTHALSLLEKPFDFSIDEDYVWNREDLDFVTTEKEMQDLWRKRVKNDYLSLKLSGKSEDKIKDVLKKRYELIQDRIAESNNEDVFQIFINSYVNLIEPHTSYLAPKTSENFKINMSLSLKGIGALLGREGDYTVIRKIIKGGPAEAGGELKKGDKIIGIGQGSAGSFEDVIGWRIDDVVGKIRGEKGTVVRLSVLNEDQSIDDQPHIISIVRDKVKLEEQAAQYKILNTKTEFGEKKVGVIDLPAFYLDFDARARGDKDFRSTTRDVKKILETFKQENVDSLVVDLRDNGGGSLIEARDLTGLFIDKGPVVQIKNSMGRVQVDRDDDETVVWKKPLVVLINRASASASEIFAAALQDYGRAVIVGERSFGKGTVQSMIPLDNYARNYEHSLGDLKLTLSQFFRINGGSTQNRGVIPDILFPKRAGTDAYGESKYDNALPWSSIKRSKYNMQGDLTSEIPVLRKRYKERELVNPEFGFVKEDLEIYTQLKDEKTTSLSELKRKQENEKRESRKKQRKQKRESILAGETNPLITPVVVMVDSEKLLKTAAELKADEADETDQADEDNEENTENNSEPADDFILMEAARIVAELAALKHEKLLAKNYKKKES